MRGDLTERFWAKVDRSGECWTWTGTMGLNGYGIAWDEGRVYAHRLSWRLANGPIPDGMHICHSCDNPPCVRPEHLFLGTASDNLSDMMRKGRGGGQMPRGHANPNSKLTPADVRAIRVALAREERRADIALRYNVRSQSIAAIETGKSWKWLDAA